VEEIEDTGDGERSDGSEDPHNIDWAMDFDSDDKPVWVAYQCSFFLP
jgi:hypothetical protein